MFHTKKLKKITEVRTTIDTKHKEMLKYFEDLQASLPALEKKLLSLQKKNKTKYSRILLQEIEQLDQEIKAIKNRKEENDYLIDTSELLDEYYCQSREIKDVKKKTSFNDFIKNKTERNPSGKDKSLYDRYMNIVTDGVYSAERMTKSNSAGNCPKCNIAMVLDSANSTDVCPNCGAISTVLFKREDTQSLSFKDRERAEIIKPFRYEKMNHLKDWLNKVQAIENTDIPSKVYEDLKSEFEKQNIRHVEEISKELVQEMLKKHGHSAYYNHINLIIKTMADVKTTVIEQEVQEQFAIMFTESVEAYNKYKPYTPPRKNFLNYAYVLHKFCELIDRDDLFKHFKYLKSRDKLYDHDSVWKQICLGDGKCYKKNKKRNSPPNYRLECICKFDGENDHGLRWDFYPSV